MSVTTVFDKVQELQDVTDYSKHERLVQGLINAIDEKIITQGSMLPSVNIMVKELGFASKTIVKAYQELKDRGLIASKNRRGYFVVNEATDQTMKVALLLYAFHPFQEDFYNAFKNTLKENTHVDVFFHHSNIEVFETILNNAKGKYGMYVVAPIPHPQTKSILNTIPRNKLLLVDRHEHLDGEYSHITQEFEIATYMALRKLVKRIREFDEIILFYLQDSDYPIEVLRAFEQFIKDYKIKGTILKQYVPNTVEKGKVYFTIGDGDLWRLIKDCKAKGLAVGKDVGIISNNDTPVKELVCDGITTFSTDFEKMGQRAAEFVLNKKPISKIIPTVLIQRNSL